VSAEAAIELRPPPGLAAPPPFDRGWAAADGDVEPFLSYVDGGEGVHWSAALEALHEESSRNHPIDVWTRRAALARLGPFAPGSVLMDLGCSTGYLLEDLREAHPQAALIGVDLIAAGLVKAHASVPDARLVQADACRLPVGEASLDGAVSLNLLEHLPDDVRALVELRRVLRPGARAVLVVPAGRRLYDYYDRFLGHARRYAHGELAAKARLAGLEVEDDLHLGGLLFPAFALIKGRNRRRYARLGDAEIERRVTSDIAKGRDSGAMRVALRLEEALLSRGVRPPAGIRGLTVVRRPRLDP
jgi:SAM-dependent methyltransferase